MWQTVFNGSTDIDLLMTKVFIDPQEAGNISPAEIIFVDCRHQLADAGYGRVAYNKEHIPRARFAHLDEDLSGEINETTGRHPLPTITDFKQYLSENAIDPRMKIVVYDDLGGGIAARLWWMLRQLGYPEVYILDGGWQAWKEVDGDTSSGMEQFSQINLEFEATEWNEGVYNIYTINTISEAIQLVDSRAPERYRGEIETIDEIPGRIPDAVNVYWQSNIAEDFKLKTQKELQANFESISKIDRPAVYYCGSGVTACFNLAVLEHLGRPADGIYPGSYSEFSRLQPHNVVKD